MHWGAALVAFVPMVLILIVWLMSRFSARTASWLDRWVPRNEAGGAPSGDRDDRRHSERLDAGDGENGAGGVDSGDGGGGFGGGGDA